MNGSQGEMTVQAIKCLQAWVQFGIPMEETAPIVQRLLLAGKNVLLNFIYIIISWMVKFIYSEKATKFSKISTLLLTGTT